MNTDADLDNRTRTARLDIARMLADWPLRCPRCEAAELAPDDTQIVCQSCHASFHVRDDVAGLMDFDARPALRDFTEEYQVIRRAEGYTGRGSAYYRDLPKHPPNEPDSGIWDIRRQSFAEFKRILTRTVPIGGKVLDLGSGNGWLSHQMAALGYRPMGMDINTDPDDGLAAIRHYDLNWPAVLTSFDQLPLADNAVDMAVFNGSLHYSEDTVATLSEVFRVLRPGGLIVVMDTPIYADPASGATMVKERRAQHLASFGRATSLPVAGYLTWDAVRAWPGRFACTLETVRPWYGLRWAMRPVLARLRSARQPATFCLLVLTKPGRA